MSVDAHIDGGILVLTLIHPPVNTIATALRAALWRGLQRAEADDEICGVVIIGSEGLFSAGADLHEFNAGLAFQTPSFHGDVLPFISAMRKPVVAAFDGRAIGGGFELGLWCHGRVATPNCLLGLPETTLGLMPGAGGTQILPRAIGLERAISLIVSGRLERAASFEGTPLLDAVVPAGELLSAARNLAERLARENAARVNLHERDVSHPQPEALLQFARSQARVRRDFVPSMLTAIDAIAMSLTVPAIEGLAREFEMFRPLVGSPPARAIRHAFFAERHASRVEDLPADTSPRTVASAAVVGAGFMGKGIAHCLARSGIPVKLFDEMPGVAARAATELVAQADTGGRIEAVERLEDLAEADLVIEAIVEQMDAKIALFARLDRTVKAGAILATNTSTLDVDTIAAATERPADVLGLHFFGPAPVMRLLEVVRGAQTSPQVLATALELARRIRKVAIVSRVAPGFIGNRIFDVLVAQALALAAEGVRPADVDAALEAEGWRMGPFRTMDLIGHDVLAKARIGRAPTAGEVLQDRLVSEGRLGQKAGLGWYRYSADRRRALPDPAIDSWLPPKVKKLSAAAIARRCLLAMINEAARVLEEGVAQRASDIDVAFLLGYGFPRLRGGPMFAATELGLGRACQLLEALARETGNVRFRPAPLLQRCAQGSGHWDC